MRRTICLGLLLIFSGVAYAAKDKPKAKEQDTLVTVNGQTLKRADVANRVWSLHATDALNQLVDEILTDQALTAWRAKTGPAEKDMIGKEVDARLKRVNDQFKDEAAFNDNLQRSSMTLESLRKQVQSQVERESLVLSAMSLSVSTPEAKEFFDANKDKLGVLESVHVRHILVSDEQKAKELLIAIHVGADFVKLAQEVSADTGLKERGGDLGFVSRGMLQPDIEKVVFSLKPGEVSDVVKSPLGYHIFKAEERREPKPAVYGEIERNLLQALLAQKVNRAWPVYLKQLRDAAKIVPAPGVTYTPAKPAGAN